MGGRCDSALAVDLLFAALFCPVGRLRWRNPDDVYHDGNMEAPVRDDHKLQVFGEQMDRC